MNQKFKKALVYEFVGDTSLRDLAELFADEINVITATDDYQSVLTADHLRGVDFFLAGVFDDFKNEYYDLETLKLVCVDWTGIDNIDHKFITDNNVTFLNTRGQATEGVAQLMLNMTFNLLRNTLEALQYAKADRQSFAAYKGYELGSRTVAIRGLGDIGSRYAEMCNFFNAKIKYSSKTRKDSDYNFVDFAELLNDTDIFANTTDINDATRGSITKKHLDGLNQAAIILSPGVFQTFVADDLYDFLVERPDVKFWWDANQSPEWKANKERFLALDNVYVTPHTGFLTHENRPRTQELVRKNIEAHMNS